LVAIDGRIAIVASKQNEKVLAIELPTILTGYILRR
jgi:hypothetical protein